MFYSISICVLFLIAGIDADCPDGSIQSSDGKLCYKAIQPTVSYGDANKVCRLIYGGLPAVQNAYDNAFINGIAIETNQSFTWLPYYYFNGAYLGPDGKPPTFTNWAPGEPTLGEGFAAALHSSDGKWRTFLYSNQNNVICAFPNSQCSDTATTTTKPVIRTTSNPVIQPTPNPNYCLQLYQYDSNPCLDTSWFFYPRTCSCYKVLSQTHFSLAQSVCSNFRFNSNLASIHSDEEAVFVTDFAMSTNNNDNWQTHHDGQDDTIIGLYRADIYSQWYYTDTTPYQGFPWVAPHSATLDYYGTLITTRAPGYRGFGAFFNTGNNICRNAVCKYSLV